MPITIPSGQCERTLDVVTKDLAVTLGAALSETLLRDERYERLYHGNTIDAHLSTFTTARHVK